MSIQHLINYHEAIKNQHEESGISELQETLNTLALYSLISDAISAANAESSRIILFGNFIEVTMKEK